MIGRANGQSAISTKLLDPEILQHIRQNEDIYSFGDTAQVELRLEVNEMSTADAAAAVVQGLGITHNDAERECAERTSGPSRSATHDQGVREQIEPGSSSLHTESRRLTATERKAKTRLDPVKYRERIFRTEDSN